MKFHKYTKIPNLYKPEAQEVLFVDEVVVEEKVDGTNVSFGLVDGAPVINSRNHNMWNIRQTPDGEQVSHILKYDGFGAVDEFLNQFGRSIFWKLKQMNLENILFYGEFYGEGIQKRIDYGNEKKFVFFDAYTANDWLWRDDFLRMASFVELPVVPCLYRGKPSLEKLEQLINKKSALSIDGQMEGIVIKPTTNKRNSWGDRIIAKFKPEKFTEKQKSKKVKDRSHKDPIGYNNQLALNYTTKSRLENVLEKMRSENVPMRKENTGKVVKAMQQDIKEDLAEEEKMNANYNEQVFLKYVGGITARLFESYLRSQMHVG